MLDRAAARPVLLEALTVVAGFTLLAIVLTYPLILHIGTALPSDLGDPLLNAWILAWGADRILHGFNDLWQAPNFFPYANTLAYSEHLLGVTVIVAPVYWLSGNPLLTYNVAFLLSYVLAGSGMYLLVRSLTGRPAAGVVAGMAFAFCPYRAAQMPHLQSLITGWMPIALWGLHRYYASGRRLFLLAFVAAFTLQGLSNGYYLYFFAVAVAAIGIGGLFETRIPPRRLLLELSGGALLVGLLLAPVIYVYYQVRQERSFVRSMEEIRRFSADLTSYFHVGNDLFVWSSRLRGGQAEGELFAGATLMLLVALALFSAWWRRGQAESPDLKRVVVLYSLLAVVAFALSLGPVPQYRGQPILSVGPYRLLMMVPGLDGLRVPARFAMIVYLAASVLAGVAVARFLSQRSRLVTVAVTLLLSLAIFAEGLRATPVRVLSERQEPLDQPAYEWMATRPHGGLLELPLVGREPQHSLFFQYRTLQHGKPIVNGFSGYLSPLFEWLRGPGTPIYDGTQTRDFFRGLRQIGVRYVAVHPKLFDDWDDGQEVLTLFGSQQDQIEDHFATETTVVFQLRPLAPTARWRDDQLRQIPASALTLSASHATDRVPMMSDGDPETRWLTGVRQTGGEWIEVRLDEARRLGRLRFEVASRSSGDYARRLRVEVSRDGENFDTIAWEDALVPVLIRSIAESSGPVYIDIDLTGAPARAVRLVQLGETRVWYWSVDELSLWEIQAE
ncbi:MAG: discoidin domain-containing protein [Vicinamibacterales bacterium]